MPSCGFRRARVAASTVVLALTAAVVVAPTAYAAASARLDRATARVIVQAADMATARGAVHAVGGTVTRDLPLIDGVSASLPAADVAALSAERGVLGVVPDIPLHTLGAADSGTSVSDYKQAVRADTAAVAGLDGTGVTVALVDTGVSPVADLAGRIVPVRDDRTGQYADCYNLSGEQTCADGYGHGTFLAGIIAGSGAASNGAVTGTAPGAKVLSVKVAGRDGATDMSTVLAAVQWVVSFRDTYGIKVLNLSLGTDSTQSYRTDPLNYAVERAWDAGIAVIVSAANLGPAPGTVTKPGDDPLVVTVGAVDDRGTPGVGDDRLPNFSSHGPTVDGLAKPDLVAPGAHLRSLRSPGSTIDEEYPVADDSPYRLGSGTSMSAAVVSGIAALVLQAHPDWSPDRVKYALTANARPAASDDTEAVGAGEVDAYAAAFQAPPGTANAGVVRSTGRGSLGLSRGSLQVSASGVLLGLLPGVTQTAQLLTWDPIGFTTGNWTATTWYTSVQGTLAWSDVSWAGDNTDGHNWGGHNWGGSSWYGEAEGTPDDGEYGAPGPASGWYGAWG